MAGINKVMRRIDHIGLLTDESKQWSMASDAIHNFTSPSTASVPVCDSAETVAASVAAMARSECRVPFFSHKDLCTVMNKYSAITFAGDSLTRHVTMALSALINQDLRWGGFPRYDLNSTLLNECNCDGQFSEGPLCRTYDSNRFRTNDIRKLGLCAHSLDKHLPTSFGYDVRTSSDNSANDDRGNWICGSPGDVRPRFLYLQGATHLGTSSQIAIPTSFEPYLKRITSKMRECHGGGVLNPDTHLRIVFAGAPVNLPAIEKKYPSQRRDRVARYNDEVAAWLHQEYPLAMTLNFYNMTLEAVNRTSDGFHSLTDVNVMKVTSILAMMDRMA